MAGLPGVVVPGFWAEDRMVTWTVPVYWGPLEARAVKGMLTTPLLPAAGTKLTLFMA